MDASRFVAESELWFHCACLANPAVEQVVTDVDEGSWGAAKRRTPRGSAEHGFASDPYTAPARARRFYLDPRTTARTSAGATARPRRLYWQHYEKGDGATSAFVYWLFYGYNDFVNNHEGDWERVAVRLVDGEPDG